MSAPSNLSSRLVRAAAIQGSELEAWEQLCLTEAGARRAFLSPYYTRAVDRARGGVYVCVLEREKQPVGFFPFQFAGALQTCLYAAEPVGGDMSDAFGLVARADVRISADELLEAAGLAACEVHHLCGTQEQHGLGAEESEVGLRVRFDGDWDTYWDEIAERNKKFRQKTERRERNVVKEHGPLHLEVNHSDPRAVLDDLIARKREQYSRTGVRDPLQSRWKRKLLQELLETSNDSCRGVLMTLKAGDTWVATHFGLQCADVLHYWFPVYSQEVAKHSPGHLLLKAIGERSKELGIAVVDRGAGDTQAKRSFANEEQSFGRGRWSRSGLRSKLYGASRSLGWRLDAMRGK